ncbi:winged helix-turn-helix domain-containing protein [Citrobacter sp. wls826]|uniref:winged helix-turn-helix domain-containing protein n=1 Tax=Citrobacter sp. wls826 TaxID=2576415 RepID=UPI0010CA17EC|nr:winged helix-turn-helix domain-containing protein [Citrobacter sp. wls826]TKU26102.1 hypothetical protein FDW87_00110 [Citrobacter sp. wls826]TKV30121.1 hypothetical protein FDX20_27270 [Citrobacter sp. TBCS-11]
MMHKKESINYFWFENYSLYPYKGLFYRNKWIRIPPKELDILTILVENAGKVVDKEFFFQKVWSNGDVGDESLTRCIYSLRKLLGKQSIETVYRKGYMFRVNVSVRSVKSDPTDTKLVAVFPFHFHADSGLNPDDALYTLTQLLSKFKPASICIMPTLVTCNGNSWEEIENIIHRFEPAYYVMGKTFKNSENMCFVLEIIQSFDHRLIFQTKIQITNNPDWINEACCYVCDFFHE